MKKVLITGSTGMVGKGVLLECIESEKISEIILVNRKAIGMTHPKIKELLLPDFTQIAVLKEFLIDIDACFYCMGVSALGMNEETYTKITYQTTKAFTDTLYSLNPKMVFNYVSGAGTDSTEISNSMWARVKGRTENMVLLQGFKDAYSFRPGMIIPEKGIKSRTGWYNGIYFLMSPFFSMLKKNDTITTTTRIGQAMINSLFHQKHEKYLDAKAINALARKR